MTALRLVAVANPAVGTDFIYTQPTTLTSLLLGFRMRLTDDANVPVRNPYLSVFESGGNLMSTVLWSAPVMGTGSDFAFLCGQAYGSTGFSAIGFAPVRFYWRQSPTIILMPGWTLRSQIDGIQVGDQLSMIELLFSDLVLNASGAIS